MFFANIVSRMFSSRAGWHSRFFVEVRWHVIVLGSVKFPLSSFYSLFLWHKSLTLFILLPFLTLFDTGRILCLNLLLWSHYLFQFYTLVALLSTLVAISFMSGDGFCSVCNPSAEHPGDRWYTSIELFCQGCVVNACDNNDGNVHDGSAPFLFRPLSVADSISVPVTFTENIVILFLCLDRLWFAAVHKDGDRLNFSDEHFRSKHVTVLGAWKTLWLFFCHNSAASAGSNEVKLDMPYIWCPREREYAAPLSTFIVSLKVASALFDLVVFCTILDQPYYDLTSLVS